jgi:hypothetical protein
MKCPKEIRFCPVGWVDCQFCAYYDDRLKDKIRCSCVPEQTEEPIIVTATRIAAKTIDAEVKKNVESIRGDRHKHFMSLSPDDALREFYQCRRGNDLHYKEPMPLDGPSSPGGSKSGKVKKSNKGTKIIVEAWQTNV